MYRESVEIVFPVEQERERGTEKAKKNIDDIIRLFDL